MRFVPLITDYYKEYLTLSCANLIRAAEARRVSELPRSMSPSVLDTVLYQSYVTNLPSFSVLPSEFPVEGRPEYSKFVTEFPYV